MNKKIISVINQKGGVGKTTTVINLAAGLSMKGKKILVIDLDPQGNATTGLGLSNNSNSETTIYNVLNGNKKISEVVQPTSFANLNLITSNVDLSGLEVETAGDSRRAFKLKDELTAILNDSGASYDYIMIDCPPSLSLLTIMALVASDALVVPLQTEFFALEGLTQLMKTIERIKYNLNPSLDIRGILLTMYDKRNKLSGQVEKEARNYFKEKVYSTTVPRNVRLSEAPSHGIPVLLYDKIWFPYSSNTVLPLMTIDSLMLPCPKLIKIDVEGMELGVLKGGHKTIKKCKPFLYVENNCVMDSKKLILEIDSLGYALFWDIQPYYNPRNFFGNTHDIFPPKMMSINMLGIPSDRLKEVDMSTWVQVDAKGGKFYLSDYALKAPDNTPIAISQNGNLTSVVFGDLPDGVENHIWLPFTVVHF